MSAAFVVLPACEVIFFHSLIVIVLLHRIKMDTCLPDIIPSDRDWNCGLTQYIEATRKKMPFTLFITCNCTVFASNGRAWDVSVALVQYVRMNIRFGRLSDISFLACLGALHDLTGLTHPGTPRPSTSTLISNLLQLDT